MFSDSTITRTQPEIVTRIRAIESKKDDEDWLGWRREVLIDALTYEHAEPWREKDVTEAEWEEGRARQGEIDTVARRYLRFAIERIEEHRSTSASRSVYKLGEYAWLMGLDDTVAAMNAAAYPPYGAPKVQVFAEALGLTLAKRGGEDGKKLDRMIAGQRCRDECKSCLG